MKAFLSSDCTVSVILFKFDLQPHLLLHVQQGFNVTPTIINRVMRVLGLTQILKGLKSIATHPLEKGAEVSGAVSEGVLF